MPEPTPTPPVAGDVRALAPLTGRIHDLKTDGPVFHELRAGRKLFEIRKDDRGYQCGDVLRLRETLHPGAEMAAGHPLVYTGQEEMRRVVGILRGPKYGLAEGWVIMSVAALSAASAAEPQGWTDVDQLPPSQTPVLLDIGGKYPIRAMWVEAKTLPVGPDAADDFGDYDEEADEWYCPAGWYEWNQHEETHWRVSATPLRWLPLPCTPPAPGASQVHQQGETEGGAGR